MEVDPQRMPEFKEPGPFKIAMVLGLTASMFLLFLRYRFSHKAENYKYANAKPRKSDLIRP